MKKSIRLPGKDLPAKEKLKAYAVGAIVCIVAGWLSYRSLVAVLLMIPLLFIYVNGCEKEYLIRKKKKNRDVFSEAIIAMADALSAGYSVEGALFESARELAGKYGEGNETVTGFVGIANKVRNSISIERAFGSFSEELDIEDARSFSEVLSVAKRMGGDLISIISNTAQSIHDRAEVEKEIDSILGAKKFELKLVRIMPPAIILYLSVFGGGLLDPLYVNLTGRVIMTVMLVVYFGLSRYAKKVVEITV